MYLNSALLMVLVIFFASCQKSSLLGNKGISNLINGPTKPVNPVGPGDIDPNNPDAEPTPGPPGPNAGKGCTVELTDFCYGGYGADTNPQSIPTKVIFLNPVGTTLSNDPAKDAKYIIDTANRFLIQDNHRFLHFKAPITEKKSIADFSDFSPFSNAEREIEKYGSSEHYVLILLKGYLAKSGGTIGYSPGLRINWKTKRSIVVMDYDYVMKDSGNIVIVHELFHGIGAPHTTDGNGNEDNYFKAGLVIYKNLEETNRKGGWQSALINNGVSYDFKIYVEDVVNFLGVRSNSGIKWDTRTLMYKSADPRNPPFQLFLNTTEGQGFNNAYSKILSDYYDQFVKL